MNYTSRERTFETLVLGFWVSVEWIPGSEGGPAHGEAIKQKVSDSHWGDEKFWGESFSLTINQRAAKRPWDRRDVGPTCDQASTLAGGQPAEVDSACTSGRSGFSQA